MGVSPRRIREKNRHPDVPRGGGGLLAQGAMGGKERQLGEPLARRKECGKSWLKGIFAYSTREEKKGQFGGSKGIMVEKDRVSCREKTVSVHEKKRRRVGLPVML